MENHRELASTHKSGRFNDTLSKLNHAAGLLQEMALKLYFLGHALCGKP